MTEKLSTPAGMTNMLIGVLMLSFSPILYKYSGTDPTSAAFYRMLFGAIILVPISLFSGEKLWKGSKQFRLNLICAFFFALDLSLWHKCITLLGPGIATLFGNLQVFIMVFYGVVFLKEKVTWQIMAAVPLAVLGLAMIMGFQWAGLTENIKLGIIYGILTAIAFAFFLIFLRISQKMDDALEPRANIAMMSIVSAVLLLGITVIGGENTSIVSMNAFYFLLAYAVMGQVLGHVFVTKGLAGLAPSLAGLLHLMQPALAYIWEILLFSKPVHTFEFVGFVITLAAVYIGSTSKKSN